MSNEDALIRSVKDELGNQCFQIHARPNGREPIWITQDGILTPHIDALAIAKRYAMRREKERNLKGGLDK